jgi:26S proteasome non-ATPase regulatory subunit 10
MDNNQLLQKLHQAVRESNVDEAQSILRANPRLAGEQDEAGWSAVHIAASIGCLPMVRLLLQPPDGSLSSALVNSQTKGGQTALHYASSRGHLEVTNLLLSQPGIKDLQDRQGWTPLHRASALGHADIITSLIAAFPSDIDLIDAEGNTALHVAVQEQHPSAIKAILEAGAAKTKRNQEDKLPVDYAMNNPELLALLQ